jgi:hypothetical protein
VFEGLVLFEYSIEKLIQHEDKVEATFKNGEGGNFDLVLVQACTKNHD